MASTPEIVAWTQWDDLAVPSGVLALSDPSGLPSAKDRARITFYVPLYMSGRAGLEPVLDMPRLRVLQVPMAGYDDALGFLRPGITLCNAHGVHDTSTAELAVGLTIAVRRGFAHFADRQRANVWDRRLFPAVADSSVAIVGYGAIGKAVHRLLDGFQVQVTAFSRSGRDGARRVAELPGVIHRFDVVILTLPLNADSAGMFDAGLLGRMRDGATLINMARGPIVDTDALVAELSSGRLSAGLDVTDPEPPPEGHPLWNAPNCIITPHVGGYSSAFGPRGRALVEEQLRRLADGAELLNVVAPG